MTETEQMLVDEIDRHKRHLEELIIAKATIAEMEASFDLRWKADQRAIERWQKATGRTHVWPDHADLCVWLLEQLDKAEKL